MGKLPRYGPSLRRLIETALPKFACGCAERRAGASELKMHGLSEYVPASPYLFSRQHHD
jgi:hypothetical protein